MGEAMVVAASQEVTVQLTAVNEEVQEHLTSATFDSSFLDDFGAFLPWLKRALLAAF